MLQDFGLWHSSGGVAVQPNSYCFGVMLNLLLENSLSQDPSAPQGRGGGFKLRLIS